MQCFSGIELSNGRIVPCQQCINCRINTGRKWTGRLLLEWLYAPRPEPSCHWFVTLTYKPETAPYLPCGLTTLRKKQFLKWLNNYHRDNGKFRYFAVGEYGSNTHRAHYHIAVFSQPLASIIRFTDTWSKRFGYTHFADLQAKRAAYLCQYTTKKLTKADDTRLPEGAEPEFRTSSKVPPIGAPALPSLISAYRSTHGKAIIARAGDVERTFRLGGKIYPLDNYMLRKMRLALGIPLKHEDRIRAHPDYLDYHATKEAEQCQATAEMMEIKYAQAKKINQTRTQTI